MPRSAGLVSASGRVTRWEISETSRQIMAKSFQWGRPSCITKCDVSKAFDSMDHDALIDSLRFHTCPETIIYAMLQELGQCEADISLGDIQCHLRVLLAAGGKQGASETPCLWNRYLDAAWQRAEVLFQEAKPGFMIDGPFGPPVLLPGC